MKKLLLITIAVLTLNGCRYVNTQEQYVNAEVSPELTIPQGVDTPNTTSTLNVPKAANHSTAVINENTPPDMPIRTKQTENGELRIENKDGFPLLTIQSDKDSVWSTMQSLEVENWSVTSKDENLCTLLLTYTDSEAQEREKSGFIKKLFRRDEYYSDHSGIYKLVCQQKGSVVEVLFSKQDNTAAKSFLADNIMNKLYEQFK